MAVSTVHKDALLTVSGVGFDYEGIPVLDNVDLSVNRGEFVALLGLQVAVKAHF